MFYMPALKPPLASSRWFMTKHAGDTHDLLQADELRLEEQLENITWEGSQLEPLGALSNPLEGDDGADGEEEHDEEADDDDDDDEMHSLFDNGSYDEDIEIDEGDEMNASVYHQQQGYQIHEDHADSNASNGDSNSGSRFQSMFDDDEMSMDDSFGDHYRGAAPPGARRAYTRSAHTTTEDSSSYRRNLFANDDDNDDDNREDGAPPDGGGDGQDGLYGDEEDIELDSDSD